MRKPKNLSAITVSPEASVRQALTAIAGNRPAKTGIPPGIALICDKAGRLAGIATNGDITKALARGSSLDAPITSVMNPKPFVIVGRPSADTIIKTVVGKIRDEHWHKDRLDKIILVDERRRPIDLLYFYDLWQGSDIRYKRVLVVGLGYVGLTLALTFAELGYDVFGYDLNQKVIDLLAKKRAPFHELGLPELLKEHTGKRFHPISKLDSGNVSDVYFIAVGTPLSKGRVPDMSHIRTATRSVGKVLKLNDIVILRSTVPVGTTRKVVVPELEKASGLIAGEDFQVAFAPERTVEGKALEELRSLPQVIGGLNRASANRAADLFNLMTHTIHIVESLEEAEVVKLINNSYRDTVFGFANEVALACRAFGIDANRVIQAANTGYPRSNVPSPSPGVGGYCLEKDPYIFIASANAHGETMGIVQKSRETNARIVVAVADDIVSHLVKHFPKVKSPKIFLMGLAFKGRPATSDLRGSPTLALLGFLKKRGYQNIVGYDAVVPGTDIARCGVKVASTISEGTHGAHAVVIMNNHEAFAGLNLTKVLKNTQDRALFFDTWAMYDGTDVDSAPHVVHRRL
jgi:UDP-N-acetyl-D-mannosaminuronic acid dehydrogenase